MELEFFSSFEKYSFPASFWEEFENNAPPTILLSTPPWYLLQYHQHFSLKCTTHATHAITSARLARYPPYPRKTATHTTHARAPVK